MCEFPGAMREIPSLTVWRPEVLHQGVHKLCPLCIMVEVTLPFFFLASVGLWQTLGFLSWHLHPSHLCLCRHVALSVT
jgi:hypothetical protein